MLTQKSELAKEFENSDSGSVAIILGAESFGGSRGLGQAVLLLNE